MKIHSNIFKNWIEPICYSLRLHFSAITPQNHIHLWTTLILGANFQRKWLEFLRFLFYLSFVEHRDNREFPLKIPCTSYSDSIQFLKWARSRCCHENNTSWNGTLTWARLHTHTHTGSMMSPDFHDTNKYLCWNVVWSQNQIVHNNIWSILRYFLREREATCNIAID